MFDHLQIHEPRERALVAAADIALRIVAPVARAFSRAAPDVPRRILLMRLERIGDLLMTLDAIADVVAAAPDATVDLVVGSWNVDVARAVGGLHRVDTLDASWLARDGTALGLRSMMLKAREWRQRQYDLAINFEPDIRSHLVLAAAGAAKTAGFSSGGGGPLLDVSLPFNARTHTSDNARALVAAVLPVPPRESTAVLELPPGATGGAAHLLGMRPRPLIGIHASAGREIKQWPAERFGTVAARFASEFGATIVLTGSAEDRPLTDVIKRALGSARVVDLTGSLDLLTLAAVLQQLDVYITGDTGPMHLAGAVGTPVAAVFGPSDPIRYAPRGPFHRIVRIDLPCSPCNRIRLPPARCVGHTPDCLAGIDVDRVYRTAVELLDRPRNTPAAGTPAAGTSARRTSAPRTSARRTSARRTSHVARRT